MKFLSNTIFIIAAFTLLIALTLSMSIVMFVINRHIIFDESHINIIDIIIKASFTLIGSTLSGFVAFMIFFLQDRKSIKEKAEVELKLMSKIEEEVSNNKKIIQELSIIYDTPTEKLATILLQENNKIKELLLIYYTQLDLSIIESTIKEIKHQNYLSNIKTWRKIKVIHKHLDLILNTIQQKENLVLLLNLMKKDIFELNKD
ncbi:MULTISPECIES: hypothetical protein [Bacillus cereus group]|uniref:hypothetical protein n=1 Tax=Bacillus cereus group TaxID=86661 RepID=UPI0002789C53|nr:MULTISPECIES: hypothetical protein [Bacillus cereus group]EJQ50043.1 hypothetical protein IEI_02995 [Bacillus wiedmannii]MEC2745135.1 hypothetical protein [Bacillus cereus]MEC2756796.1 hypothetical protein [Bacillus cereus]MEC2828887.1 hypothetical protein [Bacillus cereus]PGB96534.1 hypothetical protein COM19_20460 [Bacillus toyonensis]